MVTYSELFQFMIMLTGIIALIYQVEKRSNRPGSQPSGYFVIQQGPTVYR